MKKFSFAIIGMLVLLFSSLTGFSQKKTMTWTTKSKAALELAQSGVDHMMNNEFALAYTDFSAALKLDPEFTIPLVFMTNLNAGETSKTYAQRAVKSAVNKTEGEKLFASLADEKMTFENARAVWEKLHTMFPDGAMLGNYYVITRATPEERFAAAQDYLKKFPENGFMYNTLGYYYMNKKDMENAKKNFEKYVSLHRDGPNAFDSMADYYEHNGDTANARKYYMMALEKYPFFNSSANAIQRMDDAKKKAETK
jgi:tetratricopeptide (TPR) repeat protein